MTRKQAMEEFCKVITLDIDEEAVHKVKYKYLLEKIFDEHEKDNEIAQKFISQLNDRCIRLEQGQELLEKAHDKTIEDMFNRSCEACKHTSISNIPPCCACKWANREDYWEAKS